MKAVTFGEIMMRLNPKLYGRLVQAEGFDVTYAGAEASVAVSLAQFGVDAAFVSKLPENELGQAAINSLRRYGVDVSGVARGGERIGIYFVEKGASQRPGKVVYDRAHSAIACAQREDFAWEKIFAGAQWFHFTGITPALSEGLAAICEEACRTAKKMGLTVSCDLNYRNKLWTRAAAKETMTRLMRYVDVCIANEEDAKDVFGIEAEGSDVAGGKLNAAGYASVAKRLAETFGFEAVAFTLRESISANDNLWSGMLYRGGALYTSAKYKIHIVDRLGGGDSFGGGLIYAFLNGYGAQEAIEFAAAASCLKHTIEGDFNLVTVNEVRSLAGGNATGRVQR